MVLWIFQEWLWSLACAGPGTEMALVLTMTQRKNSEKSQYKSSNTVVGGCMVDSDVSLLSYCVRQSPISDYGEECDMMVCLNRDNEIETEQCNRRHLVAFGETPQ